MAVGRTKWPTLQSVRCCSVRNTSSGLAVLGTAVTDSHVRCVDWATNFSSYVNVCVVSDRVY
jgi:hypothetical protein